MVDTACQPKTMIFETRPDFAFFTAPSYNHIEENNDQQDESGNYLRRERSYGQMSRSFYIAGIDDSKATAEFKDGVLKVQLPKTQAQPEALHQIPISCAG